MQWLLVFPGYFAWHYTNAFKNIWHVWMNIMWFINRIFSIPLLIRTLFAPWHRMTEEAKGGFDLEDWAERTVVNIMSRVVGALVRIPIIILGVVSLVTAFLTGLLFYVFWVFAPVIVVLLFMFGIFGLF